MSDVFDPEIGDALVHDFKSIAKAMKPQGTKKGYDQAFNTGQWNNAIPWGFYEAPETD